MRKRILITAEEGGHQIQGDDLNLGEWALAAFNLARHVGRMQRELGVEPQRFADLIRRAALSEEKSP